jgi:hypothetical protein
MVNKHISGNHIPVAYKYSPQTKIIVLEVARAETFIQKTDVLYKLPLEKHAETDNPSVGYFAVTIL